MVRNVISKACNFFMNIPQIDVEDPVFLIDVEDSSVFQCFWRTGIKVDD